MDMQSSAVRCKSILKWPGGKSRVLDMLLPTISNGKRLIEPFVGSGVVFMNTPHDEIVLNDINNDLMDLFDVVRNDPEPFIQYLKRFFTADNNEEAAYYTFRSEFNETKDKLHRSALLVYLNKHCYNGLVRYNKKGLFNTPFGAIKSPYFPELEIRLMAKRLQKAILKSLDFEVVMDDARSGDIVYCDPPYQPLSQTASFTAYTSSGFDFQEQIRLANTARRIAERGAKVVISNHDVPEVREIYEGAKIIPIKVRRQISQKRDGRNKVDEIIAIWER